jgi:shikimate kinase
MATGGGAPCFFDNMEAMNKAGKTIFLDVPAREIAARIMRGKVEERPLLRGGNGIDGLKDQIEFLRTQRIPYYRQAQIVLNGSQITVDAVFNSLAPQE